MNSIAPNAPASAECRAVSELADFPEKHYLWVFPILSQRQNASEPWKGYAQRSADPTQTYRQAQENHFAADGF